MTRLPADCYDVQEGLLPFPQALEHLRQRVQVVVGEEDVPLSAASGRVLAADVTAPRDVPAFDNAALDGYAVACADLAEGGETVLPIAGYVAAGTAAPAPLVPGHAVEILTGAPVPAGADAVVMSEQTERLGDQVRLPAAVRPGQNIRRAGEDMAAGAVVLGAGQRLRPQDLGLIAATGAARVRVRQSLQVALFSTGNEVVAPGASLPPGAVFDANRPMLAAILSAWGYAVTDFGILPDDPAQVRAHLSEAAGTHHVVVASGGASKSAEDHVVAAVRALGQVHFWRLAIKPGRPVALGQIGEASFVGLPGNPVAAAICLLRIARPVLGALAGRLWLEPCFFPVTAAFAMTKKRGRREFLRGVLKGSGPALAVKRFVPEGSGILTSLTRSHGLIELAEEVSEVREGDQVDFVPYTELLF